MLIKALMLFWGTVWIFCTLVLANRARHPGGRSSLVQITQTTPDMCEEFQCSVQGTECEMIDGQPECVCISSCPRPQSSESFICASDGNTYYNRCLMDKAACKTGKVITVISCSTSPPARVSQQSPQAITQSKKLVVPQSGSLTLQCNVTGHPIPSIRWTKMGVSEFLTSASLHGVTIEQNGALLTIHNASPQLVGKYQCLAVNQHGFVVIPFDVTLSEETTNGACQAVSRHQMQSCNQSKSRRRKFWTYDPDRNVCVRKRLQNCSNIANKYNHQSECEKSCLNNVCALPLRQGSCFRFRSRMYYDATTRTCKSFVYGGCHGNGNNFKNAEECERTCGIRPASVRPSNCEVCENSVATSFCDNDFAFAGFLLRPDDPLFPILRVHITAIYKDIGGSLKGADKAGNDFDAIREFEQDIPDRCPCPDFDQLRVDGGTDKVEVILSGNYRFGIPTISQRSLGVLATTQNKNRMQSNMRSPHLCTMLNRLRSGSRT